MGKGTLCVLLVNSLYTAAWSTHRCGECWNHCQSAERQKPRSETYTKKASMPSDGQSQLPAAITQTYTSVLGVETSKSAWTQVNSELPRIWGANERQQHLSFLCRNRDAALLLSNDMDVACFNAQKGAAEQGNDLKHTCHTSSFRSQRQPAQLTGARTQACGTSSASSL